jgi:hypothetical protein
MIDSDKIKIGDTVWFDNGGKIECGRVAGYAHQPYGPMVFNVKKHPDQKGFAPILEGWFAYNLYESKLACLQAILNANDTRVGYLASELSSCEKRSNDLAAQIKEEEKARIPKATLVRFDPTDTTNGVLVKLPSYIDVLVRDRDGDSPVMVRTDHFVLTARSRAGTLTSSVLFVYPATASGFRLTYDNRPYTCCNVPGHRAGDAIRMADIRAAVKSLGFELAE